MSKIIEINDLVFGYNEDELIFNKFSVDINEGDFVVVLGNNGSGKSTLAKLIMGLVNPKEGVIKIDNEEMNASNVFDIRKKLGIVFQNPDNQFIGSTVQDDIAFGLENRCVEQDKMDDIINEFVQKVHMEEFLHKEPSMLSGGQKQRVAIASVLAMNPSILILDEATSMLDPKGKNDIINLILEIKKMYPKLTIISITHSVEEIMYSNDIIVLNKGEILLRGSKEELISNPIFKENFNDEIPFLFKMREFLNSLGIDASDLDEEEMVKKLCQ